MKKVLCSCIQEAVIGDKRVLLLTEVHYYHHHLLLGFQSNTLGVTWTAQKLKESMKQFYGKKLLFVSGNKRKGNIIFDDSLSLDEAIEKPFIIR